MISDIPKIFDSKYYDEKYFADTEGKSFCRAITNHWGYHNPEGEWLGCKPIVEAWKSIFNPKNILDVGCGRGTFIAYARDIDIAADGFDYSEWAIDNLYPRCKKEWVQVHDATKKWPYPDKSFDLVTVVDLMEHIYIEDVDTVIDEAYRVANKWVFFQIATVKKGSDDKCYIIKKGEQVPIELECCAVAGHILVQTKQFWAAHILGREEWKTRPDLVVRFYKSVPSDVIDSWIQNTLIIMERE